mmetsp:Transcript_29512/g.90312  ORF Transcript_29512/g.90312 Transcript_29512/m.90312 type:complete len:137 (+) Transcript_29512:237-647(+)
MTYPFAIATDRASIEILSFISGLLRYLNATNLLTVNQASATSRPKLESPLSRTFLARKIAVLFTTVKARLLQFNPSHVRHDRSDLAFIILDLILFCAVVRLKLLITMVILVLSLFLHIPVLGPVFHRFVLLSVLYL